MQLLDRISPAMKLAFSLTLLVLSIVSIATAIGMVPDSLQARLDSRARIAEALAIQLSVAASVKDAATVRATIEGVTARDEDILSIGIRRPSGEIVAASSAHEALWAEADPDRSTQTHVRIPISDGSSTWGTVEIAFAPVDAGFGLLGIPSDLMMFAGFVALGSLAGMYLVLRMALRQLDPAQSVPSRVQNAFDSLSDGIAVIDEKDTILLVNQSLSAMLGGKEHAFVGASLSRLLWRHWNNGSEAQELPWTSALRDRTTVRDVAMNLRNEHGAIVNVLVNASCVATDDGKLAGALVTFKDVTVLERKNMDLSLAYTRLQQSETEIKKQNSQLQYLATHDPLTGCMNRRALFEDFEKKYRASYETGRPLTCLMIDIDHFKSVNDTYGHATGDDVIAGLAKLLRDACGEPHLVGRYGGEEFCVVLDGLDVSAAANLAETLRQEVKAQSPTWLKQDKRLSISLGIAAVDADAGSVAKAVDNADQALYAAKKSGRDRAVLWQSTLSAKPVTVSSNETAAEPADRRAKPAMERKASAPLQSSPLERFLAGLAKSIAISKRENRAVAVICVNLDSLDAYADAFGPQVAAEISIAVEARLNAIFRDTDTVSLMSGRDRTVSVGNVQGNRFLIEVANIDDTTSVAWILHRLAERLAAPMRQTDNAAPLRFSIGASLYPNDGLTANEVVQNAIIAQKRALEIDGDKAFRMFSNDMFEMVQEQLRVERGIREAMEKREFHLHFQPIVNIAARKVSGAEVLLRSSNRYLQNTSIDAVIQVAEKTGLIHDLSRYVFEAAFSTLARWRAEGVELPLISVNISAKLLQNAATVLSIHEQARKFRLEPSCIQLEMTETAMVTDLASASRILHLLQSDGFHIALDDFGTGGSSLSHLLEIKPDTIKIDKSFIHALNRKYANNVLVTTITELSQKIGAKVVAEGVETSDQLAELMNIGCEYVQGYFFSRPLPEEAFRKWLAMTNAASHKAARDEAPMRKAG